MTNVEPIIDATRDNFAQEVLDRSASVPVLVDFWAAWCAPCQMLMPILHSLADEYQGGFVLARVNSDEQQELAAEYAVRSIPTVKVFRHGKIVDEFTGVQPEPVIREIIERHIERESDKLREQARGALEDGDTAGARELLDEARRIDPRNHNVVLDLAALTLREGDAEAALQLINGLPPDARDSDEARALLGRARFVADVKDAPDTPALEQALKTDPNDLNSRYLLAARRIIAGDHAGGMDHLLEIMRRDRGFRDDIGRSALLAVFEMIDDDDLVNLYRRKLSQLLY